MSKIQTIILVVFLLVCISGGVMAVYNAHAITTLGGGWLYDDVGNKIGLYDEIIPMSERLTIRTFIVGLFDLPIWWEVVFIISGITCFLITIVPQYFKTY